MNTRNHALRNTFFSSMGIYIEYSLGMVAAVLIARTLGPHSYGIYGLYVWFAAIGIVITNSGITTGVIKFIAEFRGAETPQLIHPLVRWMRRVQAWHMIVVFAIAFVLYALLGRTYAANLGYIELALLIFAVTMRAPYMFNVSITKGFEAFDATARVSMVAAPTNLLLVVIAMFMHASIFWFLVVYAVSSTVFLLVSKLQAMRLLAAVPDTHAQISDALMYRIRRHLRLVSATIIIGFLAASDIEILFLNMFDSATSAGYFKVAFQLAKGIVLLVPGVFGGLLLPMMAKALSQGESVAGRRFVAATSYLVLLAVPVVAFGMCFSGPIIGVLYGPSYAPAAQVFALVILCSGIKTSTSGASSLLVSADRQHTILILLIVFGLMKFGLDISLIRLYGLLGAMIAIGVETGAMAIAYVAIAMRVGKVRLDGSRLLRILASGAGASLASLPILGLHINPWIILCLGGIVLVSVYAVLTLVIGCWTLGDIEQFRQLHQRFGGGRPRFVGRVLGWAAVRAGERVR